MDTLTLLVQNWGPWLGLVLFFIWRDYIRERTLQTRLAAVEDFQRTTLTTLTRDSIMARAEVATALKELTNALRLRPCIAREIELIGGKP